MPTLFWIWLAGMIVFLIIEILSPTFIFFPFAIGALAAALYTLASPEAYYWQIGIFAIVSMIILPFSRKLARRISREPPELSNIDRMIGGIALVTEAIDPDLGGKVRFEGEIWQARAEQPIAAQTKVKILAVTGTRVQVEPVTNEKGEQI